MDAEEEMHGVVADYISPLGYPWWMSFDSTIFVIYSPRIVKRFLLLSGTKC